MMASDHRDVSTRFPSYGCWVAILLLFGVVGCKKPPAPAEQTKPVATLDAGAPAHPSFPQVALAASTAATSGPLSRARWGSREVLILADSDDRAVVTLDAATLDVLGRMPLPGAPSAVTVAQGHLYVALRDASAVVELHAHAMNVGTFELASTLATRAEPVALAPSEKELFVLSAAGRSLERFSLESKELTRATSLSREPRSLLLLPNGEVVVGHATRGPLSIVKSDGTVDGVDLTEPHVCTSAVTDECMTISDIQATQHFALGELDGRLVVLGALSTVTGSSGSYGGGAGEDFFLQKPSRDRSLVRALNLAIDMVSLADKKLITAADRRRPGRCSLPRAMVVDRERKEIVIACMGDQHLSRYGLVKVGSEWVPTNVMELIPLPGAPSALSVETSGEVVAWAGEARTLTRFLRADGKSKAGPTRTLPLEKSLDPAWKHGRELFHTADTRISTLGFSCAHCHPDGRDDDVLWSTPRGKRRPMSLVDLPESGPYGWDSQSPTLERHVKDTITIHLSGAGLAQEDMDALLTYVRSLRRPVSPRVGDGEKAFQKADCNKCHDPTHGYGDGAPHMLAKDLNVRTPRLFGLGGRRTYFHDGRYESLDALLQDRTVSMGEAAALSPDERRALVTFLESL